jgi:hypothetical protein
MATAAIAELRITVIYYLPTDYLRDSKIFHWATLALKFLYLPLRYSGNNHVTI